MEDVVLNARTSLAPRNVKALQWISNSDSWSYTDSSGSPVWKESISRRRAPLFSLASLNASLKALDAEPLERIPAFKWETSRALVFKSGKFMYRFYPAKKVSEVVLELPTGPDAANIDIHESTHRIAYTVKNNLFLLVGGIQVPVTNEPDPGIVNGQLVHRQEFGIHKGTFWSPDGNKLAFYRKDERMVSDYPIPNYLNRPAAPKTIKYPMAGDSSHQVTVGIYDVNENRTIFLETGKPRNQYLTNIAWSPDERHIYIAVLNRGQDHMRLNQYDAASGAFIKTLFEEKDKRYVQPLHPMLFVPGKPGMFVWQSRRDGWNHLYLYDIKGSLIRQLTTGTWEVTDFKGMDPKGKQAYFISTTTGALNRDLYAVPLSGGKPVRHTKGKGIHRALINDRYDHFIDRYASMETPRRIMAKALHKKSSKLLLNADNPLDGFELGKVSVFNITNDEGDELHCRMVLPTGFDSTQKYPVIVYVYNGPNIQLINNGWQAGANLWYQYMAQHGFIMFTVDGRGSANRGMAFEQSLFRKMGTVELEDQLAGVKFLKSQAYVDTSRMGIHGWSYGGFMTTGMVTRHPGNFKVAVAGGSVIDWSFYEVMYTERYMDTPHENPQGYDDSNLLNYVQDLDCKLLMIHGTSDDVVVYQHQMVYLKEAIVSGKQVECFAYPGYGHNVRGKDRIHLLTMISKYFMEHL